MTRALWLALAIGGAFAACGGGQRPAPTGGSAGSAAGIRSVEAPPAPDAAPAAPPASAVPLDQDLPRLVALALAQMQEVAHAFDAAGTDCAAATGKLARIHAMYAEVNAANAKILRDHRAKELRAALAAHDAEFDAAAQAIMHAPTMAACAHDAAFAHAIDDVLGES